MNEAIFYFLYGFAHQSVLSDKLIVFFALYFPYIVVILAGLFLLFHHEVLRAENPFGVFLQKKKEILLVFFSAFFAWATNHVLKLFFQISRPFEILPQVNPLISETGYAFPSTHASFFMALAVSIFLTHRKAGYVFIFFALLIGLSRVIVAVHSPVDILAGLAIGILVAYFVKKV